MERLLFESLKSGWRTECVIDSERCESRSRWRIGTMGELPGRFSIVGDSVSGMYCGTLGRGSSCSRGTDWRAADEEDG
jgi:hypothetical protein